MLFEKYSEDDYEAVCDFLIELNRADRSHINWNWARFEWMYEHPEFDKGSLSSIGLWRDDEKVVGAAIYDMYFGEGFCGVLPGYISIYPEVLKYACYALKDEEGFSLAVCDDHPDEIKELQKQGFSTIDQSESIMELDLSGEFMAKLPEGLSYYSPDPMKDACNLEWLFWQGFDHGEEKMQFVSGASSYTRYIEGIEIEVDTVPEERRKGLALVACAALILRCLDEGLYPSWDAQNMDSVHLAEKLGYEFDHEYTAYEVAGEERTH